MITPDLRRRFDELLEAELDRLPPHILEVMDEVPLIVEDEPSARLMDEMDLDPRRDELCGLHWGVPITRRSVEHSGTLPDRMMLFRGPIIRTAGVKRRGRSAGSGISGISGGDEALRQQVRITLLHEIGHHFGLDEDDLAALGYA